MHQGEPMCTQHTLAGCRRIALSSAVRGEGPTLGLCTAKMALVCPWQPIVDCATFVTLLAAVALTRSRACSRHHSLSLRATRQSFMTQWAAQSEAPPHVLRVVLLGGTGRIGTAAAIHLLQRTPAAMDLVLIGRDEDRGAASIEEVQSEVGPVIGLSRVSFQKLDWSVPGALHLFLEQAPADAVLHTAGPFDGDMEVSVLRAAIDAEVSIYVDVADPIDYIASARAMSKDAEKAQTMALVSAGAFPGFSNVLAIECARRLDKSSTKPCQLQDLDFAYFTSGLGGAGPVNLLITNLGFGEPVPLFRDGKYSPQTIAGSQPRRVRFFLDESDPAFQVVGERDVWAWPFPEAATVAGHLGISGNSSTGMGTAPGIWNTILVALVSLVPRELWRERWFSEGLAWFSLPLVWVTDQFVNETHAIRVEVSTSDGRSCVAVQTHQSFRRCVGQSVAEFALDLLERRSRREEEGVPWRPGVWLPEEVADDETWRPRLLEIGRAHV